MTTRKTECLLRRPSVEARVGLRATQIYQLIRDGQFPRPVSIGKRAVAWVESEIEAWIAARVNLRSEKAELCAGYGAAARAQVPGNRPAEAR